MGIFSKFKKINIEEEKEESSRENYNIIEYSNYMLSDVRKNDLNNCYSLTISKLAEVSPVATPVADTLKNIVSNKKNVTDKLYKISNLGSNDSLKVMKDGKTYWGAIKRGDGTSAMAKLKEVETGKVMALDPTIMMMSVALAGIEKELGEIKELNKKIFTFLEQEKESEIESDLEILNRSISDYKFNIGNIQYLDNNHKQVMDIKRTANKNMLFYKKQIKDDLTKEKILTTNSSMNSLVNYIEKKFKYYRLSLYIYSYATLMEILLLSNYQNEYLISKQDELNLLDKEYSKAFNAALNYVKKLSNKSLEGNVLSGLGSAGKVIGNLAEKAKVKNVDMWLNEKGDNLKQSGQDIKNNFVNRFEEIKESNSKPFINQIEKMDIIYNKTKEIYFDNENIYLDFSN